MSATRKSLKQIVRHFTWSWYTIVMGTGIVSTLVERFHWGAANDEAKKVLTLALFFLNLASFILISTATIARYLIFPELWPAMLRHPTQSLFMGALPMGACTLINIALVAHEDYGFAPGHRFLYALWGFWWIDAAVSVVIAVGMLNTMITTQKHSLGQVSSLWILPVVPCIVASSTGGLLAAVMPSHVELTTAVSMVLVLIGLTLALMMLTTFLLRLIIHGSPDTSQILASFIPLGPMGQGGFSLLVTAQNLVARNIDMGPYISPSATASAAFCGAWLLWSMGLVWLAMGLSLMYSSIRRKRVPFTIGYWGMIFPSGVFALLTVELGDILVSPTIQYLGVIFSISVASLWTFNVFKTVPAIWDTSIFHSPRSHQPLGVTRDIALLVWTPSISFSLPFLQPPLRIQPPAMSSDLCPVYAPFFSAMGCTSAIVFTCIGASYGTAKSGVGIAAMSILRPDQMMKCVVPVIMAGIIAIYGLVVSVLIASDLSVAMSLAQGFVQLGAGLSVGLAGLAAGFAIGIVGDAGVRGTAQQPRLFVGMILILIFAEVLGLYGLIVALIMNTKSQDLAGFCS
ncbi:hypothetical protein HMN09_00698200 [Mycena chlorophos]|uniref:V-type proton ATPase subunit C n=1 Tax=Mycena chlorophos TaxID=658473 RepID=A0A8H6W8B1_MYCCL|nr:hypothetical protein HMN09_00698200 [Mycena chlorophos]